MAHDLKIFTENIEPAGINQIYNLMKKPPFEEAKVRIMPDAHAGNGCVVGFTATMGDMVMPNVIGVDIGCGMLTVELGKRTVNLKVLDEFIRKNIPAGSRVRSRHDGIDLVKRLYCFDELRNPDMKTA